MLLNITANDLGFTNHVIDCTVAWTLGFTCNASEQAEIVAGLPAAANGLRKAIDEIRAVMSSAGYSTSQYKLVIQGYASPIPVGADIRYPQSSWDRLTVGGCPFYDVDANWAKNTATPTIVNNMRNVASEKGARFLDVRDSLNGHEVCNRASSLVTGSGPNPVTQGVGALDQHRHHAGRRAGVAAPERLRRESDRQVHRAVLRAGERQPHLPQHARRGLQRDVPAVDPVTSSPRT